MFATIVIPCCNEQESLPILYKELKQAVDRVSEKIEIVLVDDVSQDKTLQIIKDICKKDKRFSFIRLNKKGGQTGALFAGIDRAKGKYLIRMDADLQDDPSFLPAMIEELKKGNELVMGVRSQRKHNKMLKMSSMIYDLIIVALFNSPLITHSASFIGFKTKYIQNIPHVKNDHRYLPLIAMNRGAKKITEIFVVHRPRQFGKSNYRTVFKMVGGIPELITLLFRVKTGFYKK